MMAILICWCLHGGDWVVFEFASKSYNGFYGWQLVFFLCLFMCSPNIFSMVVFVKLIIDYLSKDAEIEKEIEIENIYPCYSLQCLRTSKRFICDTFSKMKNKELVLYDMYKEKYRLFWNEKYGTCESFEKTLDADKIKITYLKCSKIIIRCEML